MNTALLLLEIQNDYFPNGRIPLPRSQEACAKTHEVLSVFRNKKMPVIHVQHISTQPDASYLLPCTKGAEFYQTVQPAKGETIIKKHYPNSFKDTQLLNHLIKNQINHLLVCGMITHQAVDATVRAAHDLGFSVTVLEDACAAQDLSFNQHQIPAQDAHHAFMAALESSYAAVVSTSAYLEKMGMREKMIA
ncbi:MAG TPA: cysteine hydrolase family protein [Gammaproteobacteria bacterium]|nr:cysteine hydrolase family protein [Gammaproteobacteria bacterium]